MARIHLSLALAEAASSTTSDPAANSLNRNACFTCGFECVCPSVCGSVSRPTMVEVDDKMWDPFNSSLDASL
jgi:hypothetical protein